VSRSVSSQNDDHLALTRQYIYGRILELRNTQNFELARPLSELLQLLADTPYRAVVDGDIQALLSLLRTTGFADTTNTNYGSTIWLPSGTKFMNHLVNTFKQEVLKLGYEEYVFPGLVSPENFDILADNIYDFTGNAFLVSRGSTKAVLKPTGEAIIYPVVASWLRNEECKLPLRIFQTGPYYRYKSAPHPYLRPMDSALMLEAHGFFKNRVAMNKEFARSVKLCESVASALCMDAYVVSRPISFNKPVSEETVAYDTLLPNGKTIQTLLAYKQGQVFSRPFNVKSKDSKDYTYQVTYGMTERTLYTTLFIHADPLGLRIPEKLAPIQIAVVARDNRAKTVEAAETLVASITAQNIRVAVYYEHEEEGVSRQLITAGTPLIAYVDSELAGKGILEVLDRRTLSIETVGVDADFTPLLLRGDAVLVEEQSQRRRNNTASIDSVDALKNIHPACAQIYVHSSHECIDTVQNISGGEYLGSQLTLSEESRPCLACEKMCNTFGFIGRRV